MKRITAQIWSLALMMIMTVTSAQAQFGWGGGGSGGGSGTVTSFSAGDLSPLFTTSEATATTTPALTFSPINAAANTWFGNATGSAAAPAFNATAIPVGIGGTGASALAGNGAVIMNAGGTAQSVVAPGSNGNVLTVAGGIWTSAAPTGGTAKIPVYDTAGSIKLLDYPNTGGDTSSIKVGNGAGTGQNANSKNNVFVGSDAGKGVTTGAGNVFIGGLAGGGSSAVTGGDNTVLGYAAGYSMSGASNSNTLIGREAGQVISTGTNNTILGFNIGITNLQTGSNNVLIGTSSNIDTPASGTSNTIQIGAGSTAIFSATGCGTPSTSVSTIAGDLIVSGTSGANGLQHVTGSLSSAQLKAIFATPITVIAAPGAGFYIRILSVSAKYIYGGTAYTGSNALNLQYSGGGGTVGQVFTSTIMTGTNSAWSTGAGPTTAGGGSTSGIDNTAVVFTCPVADYAVGTGTINYDVLYERVAD